MEGKTQQGAAASGRHKREIGKESGRVERCRRRGRRPGEDGERRPDPFADVWEK